jgi:hypothetical protein
MKYRVMDPQELLALDNVEAAGCDSALTEKLLLEKAFATYHVIHPDVTFYRFDIGYNHPELVEAILVIEHYPVEKLTRLAGWLDVHEDTPDAFNEYWARVVADAQIVMQQG